MIEKIIDDLVERIKTISGIRVDPEGENLHLYFVPENYKDQYRFFPLGKISSDGTDFTIVFDPDEYNKRRKVMESEMNKMHNHKKVRIEEKKPIGAKVFTRYGESMGRLLNFFKSHYQTEQIGYTTRLGVK